MPATDERPTIRQVQPHAVAARAVRAIVARLGYSAPNAVISCQRDPARPDTTILHVNSGGNALAVQPALRAAGYTVTAGWDDADDEALRTTYGVKLRVGPTRRLPTGAELEERIRSALADADVLAVYYGLHLLAVVDPNRAQRVYDTLTVGLASSLADRRERGQPC